MAVLNSRNEIQASIEDSATMLSCMVHEIYLFYSKRLSEIANRIANTRNENAAEDTEILMSMLASDYQMMEWYEEVSCQTLQAFIPKVYSYAEKHIEGLLGRIPCTTKKASAQYSKEMADTNGVSDIEKGSYILCKHYNLSFDEIMLKWPGFKEFHSLRKEIEHRYKEQYSCSSVDYVLANIDRAKEFLSSLEQHTRHKPSNAPC